MLDMRKPSFPHERMHSLDSTLFIKAFKPTLFALVRSMRIPWIYSFLKILSRVIRFSDLNRNAFNFSSISTFHMINYSIFFINQIVEIYFFIICYVILTSS